jgi:UDP-2-acetamido-2,6-beta-L-arabino-hexul-4-ose reductase
MKILVTGAAGFLGRNLVHTLRQRGYTDIFEYDIENPKSDLEKFCLECDAVFHLAGVNRPKDNSEFMSGNLDFTGEMLNCLRRYDNKAPVVVSSSVQAVLDNPYGRSKEAMENLIFAYGQETGAKTYIYRLPNLFGKWCRPNYNSVVATFCHNIARNLEITINDPETEINLAYIDDACAEFISALEGKATQDGDFFKVPVSYKVKLGEMAELLYSFQESRKTLEIPCMSDSFVKKLYATYLSYLSEDDFAYPLKMNINDRGSFTEFIRTSDRGQVSVNISKPGTVKGNHWHHTKNEKFLVLSGLGVIRLRHINGGEVTEYYVDGTNLQIVDIPPGYTHNIENLGDGEMVTMMWASEAFDPDNPDTYFLEV